jgi:fluoride ion exporter CrcB/FEX
MLCCPRRAHVPNASGRMEISVTANESSKPGKPLCFLISNWIGDFLKSAVTDLTKIIKKNVVYVSILFLLIQTGCALTQQK